MTLFPQQPSKIITIITQNNKYATTANNSTNTNENIAMFNKVTAQSSQKNQTQKPISNLVKFKNAKKDNVTINTDLEVYDGNEKTRPATIVLNTQPPKLLPTTYSSHKFTLDICPENPSSVINSSFVHRNICEAIKTFDDSTIIITHDNTRIHKQ